MELDKTSWFAEHAGLPVLEEDTHGRVLTNRPGQSMLGKPGVVQLDLANAAAALAHCQADDPLLTRALDEARRGTPTKVSPPPGRWQLFVLPGREGCAKVVVMPTATERSSAIERRAAAADLGAGVAHEVANALSAILGWAQLGAQREDRQGMVEAFDLIERSARAAHRLARQLLDVARTDPASSARTLDVCATADDVVRLLNAEASSHGVRLSLSCPPHAPSGGALVRGAAADLFMLLWNLTQNAVEAVGQDGSVAVIVTTTESHVRIVVEDDGPGMDLTQQRRVFEPYYTTKPEGTGLGLALVKRAIDALGGRIALESEAGRGTRFVAELVRLTGAPAMTAPAGDEVKDSSSSVVPSRSLSGARVLVVDDDESVRELVATALSLRGAQVCAASSLAETRELNEPFDVALIDIALADESGERVLIDLRERSMTATAALVSGASLPPNDDPRARPDAVLRKPFELTDLERMVSMLLRRIDDEHGMDQQEGRGELPTQSRPPRS